MAYDNDASNVTTNNEGPSIASSGIQPFRVPVHFIDKNTTIDADFAITSIINFFILPWYIIFASIFISHINNQ